MFLVNKKFFEATKDKFFYGWVIVGIGSLGIFTSGAGQSHTFSPFIPVISQDLKISSTSITTAYMIATLFAAFLLPKMGKLVDKYGPRKILIYTVLLLGIGCMIFGAASNFLMLAIAFGFLRFFGQGSLMLGSANIITQWFDKKRGFALGLMGLGFAISMGLHPYISDFLISNYGWRMAWVILGLSTWLIMLPSLIFLAIDKPEDVSIKPDGIFLSNGPGDPFETYKSIKKNFDKLLNLNLPIFGICIGHQLLALAFGAQTEKMKQGHRGANHPVYRLKDKTVEITSQNHGFKVVEETLPSFLNITHKSLFDGTIEGLEHKSKPIFSVQYHPEASPGPHDSRYLFQKFYKLISDLSLIHI